MNNTDFEHRLREEVRSQPVPQPTEKLLAAIVLRRQTSEPVELPTDPVVPPRSGPLRWVVISAIAAALLVMLVPSRRTPRDAQESAANAGLFGVEMLMAQATDHPTFPVIRAKRELPARSWRYAWQDTDEPGLDSSGTWLGERRTDSYQSTPAYRYDYSTWGQLTDRVLSDTVWFDRETLLPIVRHAVTSTGETIVQEFKEKSVLTGRTTATGWTQWISEDYNVGLIKMAGESKPRPAPRLSGLARQVGTWRLQILTGLEAAELGHDWRGSLEVISAPGGFWASRFWLNFQVVGEERVTVPAGTFDTWKVQAGEDQPFLVWVSKDEHQIVQTGGEGRAMREVLVETRVN